MYRPQATPGYDLCALPLSRRSCAVHEPLQIGFHLSARVEAGVAGFKGQYNVAVSLDRKRINACTCTCSAHAAWCSHIVAVCLQRIHQVRERVGEGRGREGVGWGWGYAHEKNGKTMIVVVILRLV